MEPSKDISFPKSYIFLINWILRILLFKRFIIVEFISRGNKESIKKGKRRILAWSITWLRQCQWLQSRIITVRGRVTTFLAKLEKFLLMILANIAWPETLIEIIMAFHSRNRNGRTAEHTPLDNWIIILSLLGKGKYRVTGWSYFYLDPIFDSLNHQSTVGTW